MDALVLADAEQVAVAPHAAVAGVLPPSLMRHVHGRRGNVRRGSARDSSCCTLLVISLFAFLCSNRRQAHRTPPSLSERSVVDVELGHGCGATGIDDAVLDAYTVYSSTAKRRGEDQMAVAEASADGDQAPDDTDTHTTCAVCLAEYAEGDELRRLPGYKHALHRLCVDEWLWRRPSCPLCRMSPRATRAA